MTRQIHSQTALTSVRRRLGNHTKSTSGCWEWSGYTSHLGYGRMLVRQDGKNRLLAVHRLAYEVFVGEIPDNMLVLHHCDNRRCMNPAHLWLGTQADNMRDMVEKGRHVSGTAVDRKPNFSRPMYQIRRVG